jgi:rhodanese-related sulfurtransferase
MNRFVTIFLAVAATFALAFAQGNSPNGLPFQLQASCYPRPECKLYNVNNPPPGWPEFAVPWASREGAENPCNLTPPLINIDSLDAFSAYQQQSMQAEFGPASGGQKVIVIDVRTPEEVYWVGVPAQVNTITLKSGGVIVPDFYNVTLNTDADYEAPALQYSVNGVEQYTPTSDVASTHLTGISYNVPVEYVDSNTGIKKLNDKFGKQVDAVIRETGADRVIFFCRSGLRSSIGCYYEFCPFEQLFPGVLQGQIFAFEVESDTTNGRGGFEGTSYSDSFIGYRGFPGRYTADSGLTESVSFKDRGLPIKVGTTPKTVLIQPLNGATVRFDQLDALSWAEYD